MSAPSATGDMQPGEPAAAPSAVPLPAAAPSRLVPTSTPNPPPGYKLVKVRKPDGSIVTVRRKLTGEEAAAAGASATPQTASTSKPSGETSTIVTVRQPDGTLVKVRRAVKKEDETPTAAPRSVLDEGAANNTTGKLQSTEPNQSDVNKGVKEAMASGPKDTSTPPAPKEADAPATHDVEKGTTALPTGPAEPVTADANQAGMQDALDEQKNFFRQRKRHQFKTGLLRGVAAIAGSAVPAIEIGDFMDGDEMLSDDDWSVDEDEDHDDRDHDTPDGHDGMSDAERDVHHGAVENDTRSTEDDDKTLRHDSNDSSGHISIDAGAAVQGAAMAAAAAGSQPPPRQPPPVATAAAGDKATTEKEKVTYKITAKELNQMEEKTAEKASRPLKKHWENMTFYIMASLSIILPLLFLLLGLFIILMNGKSITSSWGSLQDVIKVAISAWPIVFAAVVAQVFKAWATYKVERGIKLMELEQLIGSNSFGSAVKQPFLLRRLDLLTLLLLVVWCLSPLGSQALQRTYTIGPAVINTTMPVLYLDMTVSNRFFSLTNLAQLNHQGTLNDVMQKMSNFYLATFLPPAAWQYDLEDNWNHPKPIWLDSEKAITAPGTTSHYGIPLIMTNSIFSAQDVQTTAPGDSNLRYERTYFNMTAAYFDFQCGDWSVVNGSYFNETVGLPEGIMWQASLSGTAHYLFYSDDANPQSDIMTMQYNRMKFGSTITQGSAAVVGADALPTSGNDSLHSLIDCSFKQKFIDFPVECYQDSGSQTGVAECTYAYDGDSGNWGVYETPPGNLKNTSGANLFTGFDSSFAQNTAPFHIDNNIVTTPNEVYLGLYDQEDKFDKYSFNLSSLSTPAEFSRRMSYLFNTWMDLGNSVAYVTYTKQSDIKQGEEDQFITVNATHVYTDGQVYFISVGWVVGYFLCAGLLLVAGTLSVIVESMTVAPDILGYVSTVARNSKYLQLPKTNSAMNGGERARVLGQTKVMMQDVKAKADVGRIALGLKHENAQPLQQGRLYR
ncbi:hypothetical protein CONLIGDRAFT_648490 [Coniochaeta ligniaria NRRL 30616]|uniref:Uncharacterized protein n=1 Tax=Coniochaeta ligniaria NRRL 30616 TaxID=1408157 RepID=A0A1J7IWH9_9PEZI|nr:hypothetical protein CONLIGDRAFT_648490 [Coniochaeta ligniaria NRRL 30616]